MPHRWPNNNCQQPDYACKQIIFLVLCTTRSVSFGMNSLTASSLKTMQNRLFNSNFQWGIHQSTFITARSSVINFPSLTIPSFISMYIQRQFNLREHNYLYSLCYNGRIICNCDIPLAVLAHFEPLFLRKKKKKAYQALWKLFYWCTAISFLVDAQFPDVFPQQCRSL